MPLLHFRNSFTSFFTALQFGLTLGGGGQDSVDCPFTIHAEEPTDDETTHKVIHHVDGMDVVFDIHETGEISGNEIKNIRYTVHER